ncbi:protein kinase domain-containing protein [Streptomyces sp. NBC_01508]|uniref:protein kinase domain-containing protein n=1 Tax=Streptomyces sp. NBC_01508 TaxID=2903888 RepID=UPI0038701DDB
MSFEWLAAEDPQRIGPYWPLRRLGAGGQGVVYEAYDRSGARCAVKVLRPELVADPFIRKQFGREVRASQAVASFCTARILSADPDAEQPYMASEFIDGRDLAAVVRHSGPFHGDGLLRLATGMATALTAIHAAGVLHRDLKPANVLIGPDGPRVIDFGIARTHDMTLTAPARMMGTPSYMAPEVLRGERPDEKGDVFAWGAVVLFATTGHGPFHGENIGEIIVRVSEHHPDVSGLAEPLRTLVAAALSKEPGDRPTALRLLTGLLDEGAWAKLPGQLPRTELLEAGLRGSARVRGPGETVAAPDLGRTAEEAFGELAPAVQEVAQRVLLRMVVPGDAADGSQDGVRAATLTELTQGLPALEHAAVHRVLDVLLGVDALLTGPDGGVRPTGAALLRAWPRLGGWVETHRAALLTAREIGNAARTWDRGDRNADDLLRGSTLRAACDWADAAPEVLRLSALERAFLDAGDVQENQRRGQQRRVRASLAVVLVLALVAGAAAWRLQRANTGQENRAIAGDVASVAESMRLSDPDTAMLLSVASWRIAPTDRGRDALLTSIGQRERARFRIPTPPELRKGRFWSLHRSLSEDGRVLVTDSSEAKPGSPADSATPRARRFDARTGKRLPDRGTVGDVGVMSPDGRFHAYKHNLRAVSVVQDLRTGKNVGRQVQGAVTSLSAGGGRAVSELPEGDLLFTDLRKGRLLHRESEGAASYDPPRISSDGSTALWCGEDGPVVLDLGSGDKKTLRRGGELVRCDVSENITLALSRDGGRAVMTSPEAMQVWDTRGPSGRELSRSDYDSTLPGGKDKDLDPGYGALRAAFSTDGSLITVASTTRVVVVRTTDVNETVADADIVPVDSTNPVPPAVAVDSEDRVLRFTSGTRLRTLDLGPVLDAPRSRAVAVVAALAPGARTLTTLEGVFDGKPHLRTWQLGTPRRHDTSGPKPRSTISDIGYAGIGSGVYRPDGAQFAAEDRLGDIVLYDARTGEKRHELPGRGSEAELEALVYGTDGRSLAVDYGSQVEIWDTHERKKERVLKNVDGYSLALGGDGDKRVLVTSAGDRVDVSTGEVSRDALGSLEDAEFSPDGSVLAVSRDEGVSLWNGAATTRIGAMGGEPGDRSTTRSEAAITELRFSADGKSLAAVVGREDYRIWDVPSRRSVGGVQPGVEDRLNGLAFDREGRLHLTGTRVRHHIVETDPDRMIRTICERVDRAPDLTRGEWDQNVRQAPYRRVCDAP